MKRSILILGSLLASGCYTFQPVSVGDVVPGQDVRTRVTGAFSDSIAPVLRSDNRVFEGVIVSDDGSAFMIEVPVESVYQGMRLATLNQRIEVPREALVDVEVKELSRTRTFGAIGIVGAVVSGIVISQLNKDAGGGQLPGGGGPQDAVISLPIVSIPIVGLSWILGR